VDNLEVSSFPVFTFSGESLEVGGDQPLFFSGQCNEFMGIRHNAEKGLGKTFSPHYS
jgi:hypothetical protein